MWLIDRYGPTLNVATLNQEYGDSVASLTNNDGLMDNHFAEELDRTVAKLTEVYPNDDLNEDSVKRQTVMQFAKLPYYVDAMEIAGLASNSQHTVSWRRRILPLIKLAY